MDTIAAVATPPGRGGVGIVRVSGPDAGAIAKALLRCTPKPRRAVFRPFRDDDGSIIDEGLALFFAAPHSFTGEDVLELHGHGGPVVMDLLLQRVVSLGVRLARPGEFSERAFLNDKLDLAQAEAIADLIDSASREAARAAVRSLQGTFSQAVNALVDRLIELRVYVESAIDFSDEEIDFLGEGDVQGRLERILRDVDHVSTQAHQGALLREGISVVIAGRPNAGKSSLLNRLAEREAAIVTHIPGTTRDVLREYIQLDGLPLHIIDTAGLRHTDDPVEQLGVQRAWEEIERADRLLLVVDDQLDVDEQLAQMTGRLSEMPLPVIVRNKVDLTGREPGIHGTPRGTEISLSAKTGAGMDLLKQHLKECMGYQSAAEGGFTARRRHLDALQRARSHLAQGMGQLSRHGAGELLAEDLRLAQCALGEITGEFTSDDLLGQIFSTFCIGK